MNKLVVVVGIVVAAVAVFFVARYFLEDKDDLSGTWELIEIEAAGQRLSAKQLQIKGLHFEKDLVAWIVMTPHGELDQIVRPYSADPTSTPKKIDLGDPKSKLPALGIYEISGDTMRICLGSPKKRPQEISSQDTNTVMVLKRVEKGR